MENLKTHPCVAERMSAGKLKVYGWVYEIHTGQVEVYNPANGVFESFE
jgi:carbonic anhydrase